MLKESDVIRRMKRAGVGIRGFNSDGIKRDSPLNEEVTGMDSLAVVEYLLALESEFKIQISDETFAELKNIGEIVNYLRKRG